MSERRDVVARLMRAWDRGEDAVETGLVSPDVVYVNPPEAVDAGTRHGHEGWQSAMRNFGGAFELISTRVEAVEEEGGRVLVLAELETRGRGSGLVATRPFGYVFDVDDAGQVTRFEWHNGHGPARESFARGPGPQAG